ncbi:unnamed protein product [Urochloa humidicola]
MATSNRCIIRFTATALACLVISRCANGDPDPTVDESHRTTYIVRVWPPPPVSFSDNTGQLDLEHWYESFLPLEPMSRDSGLPTLLHTYSAAMTGFAARLTETETASVAAKHDVLGVFPSSRMPLHTTHSPEFLGLRPPPCTAATAARGAAPSAAWARASSSRCSTRWSTPGTCPSATTACARRWQSGAASATSGAAGGAAIRT